MFYIIINNICFPFLLGGRPDKQYSRSYFTRFSWGPLRKAKSWPIYIVNGYKFHTFNRSDGKQALNYGVCVRGTNGQLQDDFYGILTDIIELSFIGWLVKKAMLFKC